MGTTKPKWYVRPAQLIRHRCSYEELCVMVCQLSENPDQTGRMTTLRVCSIYRLQRWASDEFGSVESRALYKRRPYMWVLQALYLPHTGWSARAHTASDGAPSETRGVHVRVHAILDQNRKHTQRTGERM